METDRSTTFSEWDLQLSQDLASMKPPWEDMNGLQLSASLSSLFPMPASLSSEFRAAIPPPPQQQQHQQQPQHDSTRQHETFQRSTSSLNESIEEMQQKLGLRVETGAPNKVSSKAPTTSSPRYITNQSSDAQESHLSSKRRPWLEQHQKEPQQHSTQEENFFKESADKQQMFFKDELLQRQEQQLSSEEEKEQKKAQYFQRHSRPRSKSSSRRSRPKQPKSSQSRATSASPLPSSSSRPQSTSRKRSPSASISNTAPPTARKTKPISRNKSADRRQVREQEATFSPSRQMTTRREDMQDVDDMTEALTQQHSLLDQQFTDYMDLPAE